MFKSVDFMSKLYVAKAETAGRVETAVHWNQRQHHQDSLVKYLLSPVVPAVLRYTVGQFFLKSNLVQDSACF